MTIRKDRRDFLEQPFLYLRMRSEVGESEREGVCARLMPSQSKDEDVSTPTDPIGLESASHY
jgi:hypothetical protein